MIHSADESAKALTDLGVPSQFVQLLDEDLFWPPLDKGLKWVLNELSASVNKALFSIDLKFINERFDCDNFSFMATAIAQLCWATTNGAPEAGLAFGPFGYITDGHCIVYCIFDDNGKPVVKFFEPQPSVRGESALALTCLNEVQLTREDISSCVCCWQC
jgi:hypothetical protein